MMKCGHSNGLAAEERGLPCATPGCRASIPGDVLEIPVHTKPACTFDDAPPPADYPAVRTVLAKRAQTTDGGWRWRQTIDANTAKRAGHDAGTAAGFDAATERWRRVSLKEWHRLMDEARRRELPLGTIDQLEWFDAGFAAAWPIHKPRDIYRGG